jgi:hypothetical protein
LILLSAPIAISNSTAAGEKNSEQRNQANHSNRLETIPEAIADEQREKIKMGNLDNSFTMMESRSIENMRILVTPEDFPVLFRHAGAAVPPLVRLMLALSRAPARAARDD